VVTDNDNVGSGYVETGSWTSAGGAGYNGDYRFAAATSGSTATATAAWTTAGLAPGTYEVDVTWAPYANRADNAPFQIFDGNTLIRTVLVNQQVAPVGPASGGVVFESLGTVSVKSGTLAVVLGNNADGYVIADAVRVAPAAPIPTTLDANGVPLQVGGGSADDASPDDAYISSIPVVTGISPDTGVSSNDGVTNATQLLISGIAPPSDTVLVYLDGTLLGSTTTTNDINWTYDASAVPIASGTHAITAVAVDMNGNVSSPSAPYTLIVDTTPPAAPVISGITPDTGISASDGITSATNPTFFGTAEPNSVVALSVSGVPVASVSADINGNWSYPVPGNGLTDGSYSFTATATDRAGNTGPSSAPYVVTIETTSPPTPVVTGISPDTGVSSTDGITKSLNLMVFGSAQPGSIVEVLNNGVPIGTTTAGSNGAWTFDNTATSLVDGTYSFTAVAANLAGDTSQVSQPFTAVVDGTLASPTIASVSLVSKPGNGNQKSLAGLPSMVIQVQGTAIAGSPVQLDLGNSVIGAGIADANGNWSILASVPGSSLSLNLTASITDIAGNVATGSINILSSLATPTLSVVSGRGNSGMGPSGNTLTLAGTAQANTQVAVLDGNVILGTAVVNSAGQWTFNTPGLSKGKHEITVEAFDLAGNVSFLSSTMTIQI
jgi:hypothetical protein